MEDRVRGTVGVELLCEFCIMLCLLFPLDYLEGVLLRLRLGDIRVVEMLGNHLRVAYEVGDLRAGCNEPQYFGRGVACLPAFTG